MARYVLQESEKEVSGVSSPDISPFSNSAFAVLLLLSLSELFCCGCVFIVVHELLCLPISVGLLDRRSLFCLLLYVVGVSVCVFCFFNEKNKIG